MPKKYRTKTSHPEGISKTAWPSMEPLLTIGIDEAGRGAWAGPLHVAGVVLLQPCVIAGVHDSKLLKEHEREKIFSEIQTDSNIAYHLEVVSNKQMDAMGGLGAAWRWCVEQILQRLHERFPEVKSIVIDGDDAITSDIFPVIQSIPKADQTYVPVCLASIIAKVTRDRYMVSISENYPLFRDIFANGKGYRQCEKHADLIRQSKYTDLHRTTFEPLKSVLLGKVVSKRKFALMSEQKEEKEG